MQTLLTYATKLGSLQANKNDANIVCANINKHLTCLCCLQALKNSHFNCIIITLFMLKKIKKQMTKASVFFVGNK